METALVIAVSHQVQALVPAATHLAAADSAEALRDRPALAEVPAWEAVDSAVGVAEAAVVAVAVAVVAEDKGTVDEGN